MSVGLPVMDYNPLLNNLFNKIYREADINQTTRVELSKISVDLRVLNHLERNIDAQLAEEFK